MIDAILYSVRDAIRSELGYSPVQCEVMPDGMPPPNMGNVFVAVHQADERGTADNCLDERFGFSVTLTVRIGVPLDRVGTQLIAVDKLVHAGKAAKRYGFNRKVDELKSLLHMNWGVLQDANDFLMEVHKASGKDVYGFCEPARFRSADSPPQMVGAAWFRAEPGSEDLGLKSEVRFADCRRLQSIATYV